MKKNKTKRYLVIGGAGFIGSNLTDELIQLKQQVIILDNLSTGKKENINLKAKFVKADIRNLKQISPYFKNIDGVFLLAALPSIQYSIDFPVEANRNNVEGVLNVLEASQKENIKRIVYSSSCSIYGDPNKLPVKETANPDPLSPYALQKYIGEEYCRLFSTIHNLETVSLRYFNVYGPRMDNKGAYTSALSIFMKQKANNQPLTITGDGTQTRDLIHVNDIAKANILAMNSKKVGQGEAINIGSGKNYSINQIAKMISDKIKYISPRIEPHDSLADNSLAKKLLNWQPKMKLEQGIRELLKIG
ncbi:NAD-dependent epimerase/dehydratase family protein [Patescibacteria group bacterium]|nr:NAD-dependent epimerase/dehydratase family protein [Patescibacteria group bacterium]MBU1563561.1 NAD-dependent epimerase/dehydratase family protein [Patescibacteria group bacterium]MBU2068103.1 NAD-dependent epimerase/dehydratase family protein [Patescibacteria group bacterium]